MGQKDLRGKLLEDYEDVFSDIFNVLLFGKKVIREQYLMEGSTESIYKAESGFYRGQLRDILKRYRDSCLLELGSLGIENQSTTDDYMAVRIMGYDYAYYRSQIDRKVYPLIPIITIVLNFSDKQWAKKKSIHSITKIPAEFKPFIQDYEIKVFDIAFLEDEIIERFESDFRLVARFFKDKRAGNLEFSKEDKITHCEEFLDFLAVFTSDKRYLEIKQELMKKEKEGENITMCSIAQALEEKGIQQGIQQGIQEERLIRIQIMMSKGYSKEEILEIGYTEQEYDSVGKTHC